MIKFVVFNVLPSGDKEEMGRFDTEESAEIFIMEETDGVRIFSLEKHDSFGSEVIY